MNERFPRFKDRARAARRRIVAVGVVAALATISLIGSSAQAATPAASGTSTRCLTQEELFLAQCILVAKLLQAANTSDLSPKDMQVAAPSSVIAATSNTPKDVNRWRPNPQAWIDAKTRLAGTSGLTSKDVAATSRWAPKLTKGLGVAGWLITGADIAYSVRDDMLLPSLGLRGQAEESFCVREGNIATDLLGMLGGANCADWRMKKDFADVVAGALKGKLALGGRWQFTTVIPRSGSAGIQGYGVCGLPLNPFPTNTFANLLQQYSVEKYGLQNKFSIRFYGASGEQLTRQTTGSLYFQCPTVWPGADPSSTVWKDSGWTTVAAPIADVQILDSVTGKAESVFEADKAAEFVTTVKCSDGSTRHAISESFQQGALGETPYPEAVQLNGCRPVSVAVGAQPVGTGWTDPATNPWNPEPAPGAAPKPGTTTVAPPAEVPQEVKDWMTNFPQCWDGSCRLTLKKVTESTTEVDCFTVPAECVDWYEESASNPTKYKCYYAGQLRALSDCFVYSRVFDKGKVQDGTGYGDPATGGQPGSDTGTKTNPGAALVAMREPVQNPTGDRQCWPTGWAAFNPFEWVFQPVRCALEWAFVPREAKLVQVTTSIKLAGMNAKPGEFVQALAVWPDFLPSGAECQGPRVDVVMPFGASYSGYPASACAAPMSTAASVSQGFLLFVFGAAGFFAITRYVGRIFGYEGFGSLQAIGRARDS